MSPYQPRHAVPPGSAVSAADAAQASRAVFAGNDLSLEEEHDERTAATPEVVPNYGVADLAVDSQTPGQNRQKTYSQAPLGPEDEPGSRIILPPPDPSYLTLERGLDEGGPSEHGPHGHPPGDDPTGPCILPADLLAGAPGLAEIPYFEADVDQVWTDLGTLEEEAGSRVPQPTVARGAMFAAAAGLAVFGALIIGLSLYFTGNKPSNEAARTVTPSASSKAPSGRHSPASGPASSVPSVSQPLVRTRGAKGTPATGTGGAGRSGGRPQPGAHPGAQPGAQPGEGLRPVVPAQAATAIALNLAVPIGFGPVLRAAWVAADPGGLHLSAADVQSTLPGSVFYAAQPSVGTYWAVSSFVPTEHEQLTLTGAAGRAAAREFAKVAVFYRRTGQGWAYMGASAPGTCPANVPQPVYAAWGTCSSAARAPVAP